MLLLPDAEMWPLIQFVVPKVMAKWDDLAYCMGYKPLTVEAIKKESKDLKECCKSLFSNWLVTSHGPVPKSYQTLLNYIKKIEELTAVSELIEKQLIQGKDKHTEVHSFTVLLIM